MPKPAVIAVNGIAFTLPTELAPAAGIVIAADDVQFRQPETGRGTIPSGGATFPAPAQLIQLPRIIDLLTLRGQHAGIRPAAASPGGGW